MQLDSIKKVCSSLIDKAKVEAFFKHYVDDIEEAANHFVEELLKNMA